MNNKLITLPLYIQPKSSREAWVDIHNNELKIALNSPPINGKANQSLISFLSKEFQVPKSNVTIIKGLLNRHKYVSIAHPKKIPILVQEYLKSANTFG